MTHIAGMNSLCHIAAAPEKPAYETALAACFCEMHALGIHTVSRLRKDPALYSRLWLALRDYIGGTVLLSEENRLSLSQLVRAGHEEEELRQICLTRLFTEVTKGPNKGRLKLDVILCSADPATGAPVPTPPEACPWKIHTSCTNYLIDRCRRLRTPVCSLDAPLAADGEELTAADVLPDSADTQQTAEANLLWLHAAELLLQTLADAPEELTAFFITLENDGRCPAAELHRRLQHCSNACVLRGVLRRLQQLGVDLAPYRDHPWQLTRIDRLRRSPDGISSAVSSARRKLRAQQGICALLH